MFSVTNKITFLIQMIKKNIFFHKEYHTYKELSRFFLNPRVFKTNVLSYKMLVTFIILTITVFTVILLFMYLKDSQRFLSMFL